MKKIISSLLLFLAGTSLLAQAPQGINYQAAARDNAGNILASQNVSFRMSVLQGNISGNMVYQETHNISTNALGLVNLIIGSGTVNNGTFTAIDWKNGPYYLQVELSVSGGPFAVMGTSQFVSVPYALYAEHSADKSKAGNGITISNDSIHSSWTYYGNDVAANNSGNVGIGVVPNFQKLEVNGGVAIGNTGTSSPGTMRFNGSDFEGYTGSAWRSFTKSSLDVLEYYNSNSHSINTNIRNAVVALSSDSVVVPATGTYLVVYTGRGYNGNSYDIASGVYDYEAHTGVLKVNGGSYTWLQGEYTLPFCIYQVNTAVTTYYQYITQMFHQSYVATLNAGDVLKPGAHVISTTPAPATNWNVQPNRIQLVKLN